MTTQNPQGAHYKLDEAANEEYPAIALTFTSRDVARCIRALDWFFESFAEAMVASNVDREVERFEDLMYRFMGVPEENMKLHVAHRALDLPGGEIKLHVASRALDLPGGEN